MHIRVAQCAAGTALLVFALCGRAETATEASIRELLTVSGQEAELVEGARALIPALRQLAPDMPEELFRELTRTDIFAETVIPIYRKYFSEEEIRELISLYKTPVGSKYAKLGATIYREGMEINARRGQMAILNYYLGKGGDSLQPKRK